MIRQFFRWLFCQPYIPEIDTVGDPEIFHRVRPAQLRVQDLPSEGVTDTVGDPEIFQRVRPKKL